MCLVYRGKTPVSLQVIGSNFNGPIYERIFTNICSVYQYLLTTCIDCKIQHHQILRFQFLRGFTAVFLFSGLGVDSEQNGLTVIYFVTLGRKRYLSIKTKKKRILSIFNDESNGSCIGYVLGHSYTCHTLIKYNRYA
jgi:hypothetical protein